MYLHLAWFIFTYIWGVGNGPMVIGSPRRMGLWDPFHMGLFMSYKWGSHQSNNQWVYITIITFATVRVLFKSDRLKHENIRNRSLDLRKGRYFVYILDYFVDICLEYS